MRKNDKPKKKYDYNHHGMTIAEYIATPGIDLWLKVLFYLYDWHNKHRNKECFISNQKILKDFHALGWCCTPDGIEGAIRTLKTPEAITPEYYPSGRKKKDGVGLIRVVYPSVNDKGEIEYTEDFSKIIYPKDWIALGLNPNDYIFRKIYIDYPKFRKYISIFSTEYHEYKELRGKSRFKKLVKKRPVSYVKDLAKEFDKQMAEAIVERSETADDMFYNFVYTYSRKYFRTSLYYNYIPNHAREQVEYQNKEDWIKLMKSHLRGTPYDICHIQEIKPREPNPMIKDFYGRIR